MYAIIVTGGKQYRVEQGDIVYIEKLDVEADSEVKFDQVLAIGEEGSVIKHTAQTAAGPPKARRPAPKTHRHALSHTTYRHCPATKVHLPDVL